MSKLSALFASVRHAYVAVFAWAKTFLLAPVRRPGSILGIAERAGRALVVLAAAGLMVVVTAVLAWLAMFGVAVAILLAVLSFFSIFDSESTKPLETDAYTSHRVVR